MIVGAAVGQLTDDQRRSLYDSNGALMPLDQRADGQVVATADATPGQHAHPEPAVLLDPGRSYSEQVGPGTQHIFSSGLDGRTNTNTGGQVDLALAEESVTVDPSKDGHVMLELTQRSDDQQTTVTVNGDTGGPTTLDLSGPVEIRVGQAARLSLTIKRVGGSRPPTTFRSAQIALAKQARLTLGSLARLPIGSILRATSTRGGHRRTLRLTNHARRPRVRLQAAARATKRGTIVTARVHSQDAHDGVIVVAVKPPGGHARTRRVRAATHKVVRIRLARQHRGAVLQIWAVVVSHDGQSSRVWRTEARVP